MLPKSKFYYILRRGYRRWNRNVYRSHQNYLEGLSEFVAHDVVHQGIYTSRNVIQNSRHICRENKNLRYQGVVGVFHRPSVG